MNKPLKIRFVGIDDWNRPVFKGTHSYYGSVNKIFNYDVSWEEIKNSVTEKDLVYFGESFNCEPCGNACNVKIDWEDNIKSGKEAL